MVCIRQGYLFKKGALTNIWNKRFFSLFTDGILRNCKQPTQSYTVESCDPELQNNANRKSTQIANSISNRRKTFSSPGNKTSDINLGALSEILSGVSEVGGDFKQLNLAECEVRNEIVEKHGKLSIGIQCKITNKVFWFGSADRQEIQEWLCDIIYVRKSLQGDSLKWSREFCHLERIPVGSSQVQQTLSGLPQRDWYKEWRVLHGVQPYPGAKFVEIEPIPDYIRLRKKYMLLGQFHGYVAAVVNYLIRSSKDSKATLSQAVETAGYKTISWWGHSPLPGTAVCIQSMNVAFAIILTPTDLLVSKMLSHESVLFGYLQQQFTDAMLVGNDQHGVSCCLPLSAVLSCSGYQVLAVALPALSIALPFNDPKLPIENSDSALLPNPKHHLLDQLQGTLATNLRLEVAKKHEMLFRMWMSPDVIATKRETTPIADPFSKQIGQNKTKRRPAFKEEAYVPKIPLPYFVSAPPFCPPDLGPLINNQDATMTRALLLPEDARVAVCQVVNVTISQRNWVGGKSPANERLLREAMARQLNCRNEDLLIYNIDGWLHLYCNTRGDHSKPNARATHLAQQQSHGDAYLLLVPGCQAPDLDSIENKAYPFRFRPEFLSEMVSARDTVPYLGPNMVLGNATNDEKRGLAEQSDVLRENVVRWVAGKLRGGGTTTPVHDSAPRVPDDHFQTIDVFHGGHLAAVLHQAGVNLRYLPAVREAVRAQRGSFSPVHPAHSPKEFKSPSRDKNTNATDESPPSPSRSHSTLSSADRIQLSKLIECELLGRTVKRVLNAHYRVTIARALDDALESPSPLGEVPRESITSRKSNLPQRSGNGKIRASSFSFSTSPVQINQHEAMLNEVVRLLNAVLLEPALLAAETGFNDGAASTGLQSMNPALALKVAIPRYSSSASSLASRKSSMRTPKDQPSENRPKNIFDGFLGIFPSNSPTGSQKEGRHTRTMSTSSSTPNFEHLQSFETSSFANGFDETCSTSGNSTVRGRLRTFSFKSRAGLDVISRQKLPGRMASRLFWEIESRAWLLLSPFGYMGGMELTPQEAIGTRHICTQASPLELLPSVLNNTGLSLTVQCLQKIQEEARVPDLRAGDIDIRYKGARSSVMTGVVLKRSLRVAADMRASIKILYERKIAKVKSYGHTRGTKPAETFASKLTECQVYEDLVSKVFSPFAERDELFHSRQLRSEAYLINACEWARLKRWEDAFKSACLGLSCLSTNSSVEPSVPLDIMLVSFALEAALRSQLIDGNISASPASLNWHLQLMWTWRMCQVFFPVSTDGRTLTVWGAHPMVPPLVRFLHESTKDSGNLGADNNWLKELLETTLMPAPSVKPGRRRAEMNDTMEQLLRALQDILRNPQDHAAVMCPRSFLTTILGEQAWYSESGAREKVCSDKKSYRSKGRVYTGGLIMGVSADTEAARRMANAASSESLSEVTTGLNIPDFKALCLPAEWTICKVSCGYRHTALLTTNGLLLTFGHGETGRLGHGDEESLEHPKVVEFFQREDKPVISVGCGREHTMAVVASGEVYSWGWGECGRLGIGETGVHSLPQYVSELEKLNVRANSVTCGREHSLIIVEGGQLLACGAGDYGRLGLGHSKNATEPARVVAGPMDHENIILASAGDMHSAALAESGMVYTWGFNDSGALGLGTFESSNLPILCSLLLSLFPQAVKATSVSCGSFHTVILSEEGDIYAFGDGFSGQLGLKDQGGEGQRTAVPHKINIQSKGDSIKARFISCGPTASSAVGNDGHLYWWGSSDGDSETAAKVLIPSKVSFSAAAPKFQSVSLGGYHTVATTELEEEVSVEAYEETVMSSLSEAMQLDTPDDPYGFFV